MRSYQSYCILILALFFSCEKQSETTHAGHKSSDGKSDKGLTEVSAWAEPTNRRVMSSQTMVKPTRQEEPLAVKAYGYITLDERRSKQVAARAGGRVESLYVKYENQYVRKGTKIMDLYSTELNAIQQELLYAHKTDPDVMKHTVHKLRLLGVTDAQIEELMKTEKTSYTLSVYSPYDGYIFYNPSRPVQAAGSTNASAGGGRMGGGMAAQPQQETSMSSASTGPVREGAYVTPGQTLFWINDITEVWGILSVENVSQEDLHVNDSLTVISELMPEKEIRTVIRFIEPQYSAGQKFTQVRVYLPNTDNSFRINSLLTATVYPKTQASLTLPASSILYLGSRQAVWKKVSETEAGVHILEIQFVKTGPALAGRVPVLEGLGPDDEVAQDAGYLMDRESLVKPQ